MEETAVTGVHDIPFERIVLEFTYDEFLTICAVLGRRTRVRIDDKLYSQFSEVFAKYHRGKDPADHTGFMERYRTETFSNEASM
jgi:hypothetical protein